MARFYGKIGYGISVETPSGSGIFVDQVIEHDGRGDLIRDNRNLQSPPDKLNDDLTVSNKISIVADQYAISNFEFIIYAMFSGIRWKVSTVEVQRPRLILSLGGVYNGRTPS